MRRETTLKVSHEVRDITTYGNTSYASLGYGYLAQRLATPPNRIPKAPPHLLSHRITSGFPAFLQLHEAFHARTSRSAPQAGLGLPPEVSGGPSVSTEDPREPRPRSRQAGCAVGILRADFHTAGPTDPGTHRGAHRRRGAVHPRPAPQRVGPYGPRHPSEDAELTLGPRRGLVAATCHRRVVA